MDKAFQMALATDGSLEAVKTRLENSARARQQEAQKKIDQDYHFAKLLRYIVTSEPKTSNAYWISKTLINEYRKKTGVAKQEQEMKKVVTELLKTADEDENEKGGKKKHGEDKPTTAGKDDGSSEEGENILSTPIPEIEP